MCILSNRHEIKTFVIDPLLHILKHHCKLDILTFLLFECFVCKGCVSVLIFNKTNHFVTPSKPDWLSHRSQPPLKIPEGNLVGKLRKAAIEDISAEKKSMNQ